MLPLFVLSTRAHQDLDQIWNFIARDSEDAANRVESAILRTCGKLARSPFLGTLKPQITTRQVRFAVVTRYPNYIVVYRPDTVPLQVISVLHGMRDAKSVLEEPGSP